MGTAGVQQQRRQREVRREPRRVLGHDHLEVRGRVAHAADGQQLSEQLKRTNAIQEPDESSLNRDGAKVRWSNTALQVTAVGGAQAPVEVLEGPLGRPATDLRRGHCKPGAERRNGHLAFAPAAALGCSRRGERAQTPW